jgi:tRNA(adenine34) deaminase
LKNNLQEKQINLLANLQQSPHMFDHAYYMNIALRLANDAAQAGEIPVGALVVCQGKIIAKAHNQTETLHDVTAHAEILALTAASTYLRSKYLRDCTLYVTLEPCVMCAGALYWSQLERVVFGAVDAKRGFSRVEPSLLHPKTQVVSGVLGEACEEILRKFFQKLRT